MTHDEFVEQYCMNCGTQRCYGEEYCHKYQRLVLGEPVPDILAEMACAARQHIVLRKAIHDEGLGEGHISESPEVSDEDKELALAAQEAHDNMVRAPVRAGGDIREARELLIRSLAMLYLIGYDSSFTNSAIDTLTTDIKNFLEETK